MGKKRATPLPEKCCFTCKHWKEETLPGDEERSGTCRRFPPLAIYDVEDGLFMAWAATPPEEICGEHSARLQ